MLDTDLYCGLCRLFSDNFILTLFAVTKLHSRVMPKASSYKINKESVFSKFNLFDVPSTNTYVLHGEDEEFHQLSVLSQGRELE